MAQRQVSIAAVLWLCVAVVMALWLNRYEYTSTQTRMNRFTGEEERRIVHGDGSAEWVRWDMPGGMP